MNRATITVRPVPITWEPRLSIYASEAHLKSVGDEYGWLGGFDESGKLRCVLPYTVVRKAVFRMVRFRVETIPWEGELASGEEKDFLNGVVGYFRSRGADMIIPATTNTIFREVPDGAVAAPYGTHLINLDQPEAALWADLHASHRNAVRKSEKRGVKIFNGIEHLPAVHEMITATLKRTRLGFMSYAALERLVRDLGGNVKVFLADHDGAPQGCAICPFSLHSAYYLYAGSAEQPVTGAMKQLNWEAMRMFQGMGVRRYDFVGARINPDKGSKQAGLSIFKERFGGRVIQGHLWKYSLNSLKYLVYALAVRLTRGGDIVDQERKRLARPPRAELEPAVAASED